MGVYERYRVLGLVCEDRVGGTCASFVHRQGTKSFVTCPVDAARSLHLYDVSSLRLKGAVQVCGRGEGERTDKDSFISAIAAVDEVTYAATGKEIIILERMKRKTSWTAHEDNISTLSTIGSTLLSLSTEEKRLILWNADGESLSDVYFQPDFVPIAVAHPPTYLNKVLVGGADGRMQLWNIRTNKLVYEFAGFGAAITVLEPSTVVDVVAVGLADGRIIVHNLRFDETVTSFSHVDRSPVTCLSFRDDGDECLVSGCQSGDLAIWDLNENRSRHVSHEVHPNGVSMATFIRGEPLLVSTGMQDNAVKVHIFDSAMGRVLRSRSGHLAPPTKIRFCGGDGRQMISAGLDREVRIVSTIRDAQNREMSQGALNKKRKKAKRQKVDTDSRAAVESVHRLSPVVDLAVGSARRGDEDFANVVTAHAGLYAVYTWQMDSGTLAKHVLTPPRKKEEGNEYRLSADVTATSVAISPTGHLCFVGYSDGAIHAYNLQSGRPQEAFNEQHNGRVTAIAVAALGETIVSSSDDLRLSFWDPQTRQKQGESIELEAAVEHLAWSAESDLIAVACTDYIVRVYDAETRKLARCLKGHSAPITDLCFAPSGRWILTTSTDSTMRTWDLLGGVEVDIMECDAPPTSVAFSPEGAFVATTHVGEIGVTLWVNKIHFGVETIGTASSAERNVIDTAAAPITDELVTLSTVPVAQWNVLANLDLVRLRNKPKQPIAKPKAAPFFLPTVKSLNPVFDVEDSAVTDMDVDDHNGSELLMTSRFGKLCMAGDYEAAAKLMRETGASGADLQLRSIEEDKARLAVLKYFRHAFEGRCDFDLTEAHLGVFLKAHGAELAESVSCSTELELVSESHKDSWKRLQETFSIVLTLTAHLTGQQ